MPRVSALHRERPFNQETSTYYLDMDDLLHKTHSSGSRLIECCLPILFTDLNLDRTSKKLWLEMLVQVNCRLCKCRLCSYGETSDVCRGLSKGAVIGGCWSVITDCSLGVLSQLSRGVHFPGNNSRHHPALIFTIDAPKLPPQSIWQMLSTFHRVQYSIQATSWVHRVGQRVGKKSSFRACWLNLSQLYGWKSELQI